MAMRDNIFVKEIANIIFLLDDSYSMVNGRIAQVNNVMPVLKNTLLDIAEEEGVDVEMRVISFSDEAKWKIGTIEKGENIQDVVWQDLDVEGGTSTNKAIAEANKALRKQYLGDHALKPIVILVTDGYCNPGEHDAYLQEIEKMKKRLAGNSGKEKVLRIAIGVEDYNRDELVEFASEGLISDVKQPLVFEVNKAADLGKVINWVTVSSMYSSITGDEEITDLGDPDWGEDDDDEEMLG